MPVRAQLYDGTIIEFPDGTDPAVVSRVAREQTLKLTAAEKAAAAPAKPQVESNLFREAADVPLKLGQGVVSAVRFPIASVYGADSPVAASLRGVEDYVGGLMSAQSEADSAEISRLFKEAEDKGIGAQVVAGLKALTIAPIDLVANALGTAAPTIAASLLTGGAAVPLIIGAATGAGVTKSAIYDTVLEETLKSGKTEEQAKQAASAAQEYAGENLDQILIGTGIGAFAAATGLEKGLAKKITEKIAQRTAAEAAKGATRETTEAVVADAARQGLARTVATGVVKEGFPEAVQGGQEQLAGNIAAQREGFDVPTMRGVASSATLEGLLGGGLGGLAAPFTRPTGAVEDVPPPPPGAEEEAIAAEAAAPPPPVSPVFDRLVNKFVAEGKTRSEAMLAAGEMISSGLGTEEIVSAAGEPDLGGREPSISDTLGGATAGPSPEEAAGLAAEGLGTDVGTAPVTAGGVEPSDGALAPETLFTTAKGSTYTLHSDGTTSRNKAYRPEHGEAQQGPQPRSEATFFVQDINDVNKLAPLQAKGGPKTALVPSVDGTQVAIQFVTGKNAGKLMPGTVVPVSRTPAAGATPIEIWDGGKNVHFGNEIVGIAAAPKAAPLTVESYVDRYLAGEGRGDTAADRELLQFGANNAPEIEAEFARRAVAPAPVKPAAVIRPDDVFRGEGTPKITVEATDKPFVVRGTDQKQVDDMIASGLVRPKPGGYGKQKSAQIYFGESDTALPTNVFAKPKEGEFTLVGKSESLVGKEGPISIDQLEHVWTVKDGQTVDVLPDILKSNREFAPAPEAAPEAAPVKPAFDREFAKKAMDEALLRYEGDGPAESFFYRGAIGEAVPQTEIDRAPVPQQIAYFDGIKFAEENQRPAAAAAKPKKTKKTPTQAEDLAAALEPAAEEAPAEEQQFIDGVPVTKLPTKNARGAYSTRRDIPYSRDEIDPNDMAGDVTSEQQEQIATYEEVTKALDSQEINPSQFQQLRKFLRMAVPPSRVRTMLQLMKLEPKDPRGVLTGGRSAADYEYLASGKGIFAANENLSGDVDPAVAAAVQKGVEGRSPVEVAKWLVANAPNPLLSTIAMRVRDSIIAMQNLGVTFTFTVTHPGSMAPAVLNRSRGTVYWQSDAKKLGIWVNGADRDGVVGTEYEILLHEFVHAVTLPFMHIASMKGGKAYLANTGLVRSYKEMVDVGSAITTHFNNRVKESKAGGPPLTEFEQAIFKQNVNALADVNEIVSWALTNPDMQEYLSNIPYTPSQSMFSKFVDALRSILRLDRKFSTALEEVLRVSERIMTAPTAEQRLLLSEFVPSVSAPAISSRPKKTKVDRFLDRIKKSNDPAEITKNLGLLQNATRSSKDFIRALKSSGALNVATTRKILTLFTTNGILMWAGDRVKNLVKVRDALTDMSNYRMNIQRELERMLPSISAFRRKYPDGFDTLADTMHLATLLGVDAALYPNAATALRNDPQMKGYAKVLADPNATDKAKKAAKSGRTTRTSYITEAYKQWDKLGKYPGAREIYTKVRDTYKKTFDTRLALLLKFISEAPLDSPTKDRLQLEVERMFKARKDIAVYFPLMRYGDFWLRIGKGAESEYHMFESASDRDSFMEQRAAELVKAGKGKSLRQLQEDEVIIAGDNHLTFREQAFAGKDMLDLKGIFGVLDKNPGMDVGQIKEQVYRLYLSALPDADMRKKFARPRQGKAGFSNDIIRNFAASQLSAASQLARLKYQSQINNLMGAAYGELKGNPDRVALSPFIDEIALRAAAALTPDVSSDMFSLDRLASFGTQVSFLWLLTAPKSAIVNMFSLGQVALPVLTARYGYAQATKKIASYLFIFNKMGIEKKADSDDFRLLKWAEPSIIRSSYVKNEKNPQRKQLLEKGWNYANNRGMLSDTYASDLTERSRVSTSDYESRFSEGTRFTYNFMTGAFHHLERITRELMFMSALELEYDMQRAKGVPHAAAMDLAMKQSGSLTGEALFDYSPTNKPRAFQMPIGKMGFQFMTYPLMISAYMVRNFVGMLPGLNKKGKKEAATKFFGTLGMTYLLSGAVGMPLFSAGMGLLQGMRDALRPDEDDEDYADWDTTDDGNPLGKVNMTRWFRDYFLPTNFGPDSEFAAKLGLTPEQAELFARAIEMGPVSALTNLNIGASTGLDNLWFKDDEPSENMKSEVAETALRMFGPFGSLVQQFGAAFDDFSAGHYDRGVEKLLPAFVRGAAKAYRQSQEGELTRKGGAPLKEREEFTTGMLLGQALGFASTNVAQLQQYNIRAKRIEQAIEKERTKLTDAVFKAVREDVQGRGSEEDIDKAFARIDTFNKGSPESALTSEDISDSLETRLGNMADTVNGLQVVERLRPYLAKYE